MSPEVIDAMDKDFDRNEEGAQIQMPRRASEVAAELLEMPVSEEAEQDKIKPTDKQIKRLFALAKESGITEDDIRGYILRAFAKKHFNEITVYEYDCTCEWIQSQKKPDREPGDEEA